MSKEINAPVVHIIDDDEAVRNSISLSLSVEGFNTKEFSSAVKFLNDYQNQAGCVITDIEMPCMTGLELQKSLKEKNIDIPIIFISGRGNISMSVKAMKHGAIDFLEKPFVKESLTLSVRKALDIDFKSRQRINSYRHILQRFDSLTQREKQILSLLTKDLAKLTNNDIANELGISKRTVEVHRSSVMSKMQAQTRAELVELSKYCDLDNSQ